MTRNDMSTADLVSWLDDEAKAPIPAGGLDQALASIASRRPRQERLAEFGSHWIDGPSSANALRGNWRISVPVLRSSSAILLLLLALALLGAAALIGSRLLERHPDFGRLVYGLDGDIYLADWDGGDPTRVADGVPWDDPKGPTFTPGSWAPDGRHFLYFELKGADQQTTAHISDADGRVVASIPGIWVDATWAPDSTRLQAWTGTDGTRIGIFGFDGVQQVSLQVPRYMRFRESGGVWAPDGRSVWVRIAGDPDVQDWQIPIDGSAPRRLAKDGPIAGYDDLSFTRDGSRVAIATFSLSVANADGTGRRILEEGHDPTSDPCRNFGRCPPSPGRPVKPMWSPDETHVVYAWIGESYGEFAYTVDSDLRIVDVATGIVQTLVADLPDDITPIGWSPAGDRILFSTSDAEGRSSLWTVNIDGSARRLLSAAGGSWQWTQHDAR